MNDVIQGGAVAGHFHHSAPSSVNEVFDAPSKRRLAMSVPACEIPRCRFPRRSVGTTLVLAGSLPEPDSRSMIRIGLRLRCLMQNSRCLDREISTLVISPGDAITDNGQETLICSLPRGIDNVIMVGVHLNIVRARPPVRNPANGPPRQKRSLNARDMTAHRMYNPERKPK